MKKLSEEISRLEVDLQQRQERLKGLNELDRCYTDVVVHTNKDGFQRLCSASINEYVNQMEIAHSCGCCEGAQLLIYPFCVVEGQKVFSNPPHFTVGFSNRYGFGEVPLTDWKVELKRAGINQLVIDKVAEYLKRHPPIDYDSID